MNLPKHANEQHKRASLALCQALTLGTQDAWWCMPFIFEARLTERERVSLSYMTLKSLRPETIAQITDFALQQGEV